MDLGQFSWYNYNYTTMAQARGDLLADTVNFMTNANYDQSQNLFFNKSGNVIHRSDLCYTNWSVHDSAAGTNQVVLKAAYPIEMGAEKFCYLRISTANSTNDSSPYPNNISLLFDVFESWNAITHIGVNRAGMADWSNTYGFGILPQYGGYQTLFIGASKYSVFCHLKGHPQDNAKWGMSMYYNGSSLQCASGSWSPLFAGILPYATGGGWHTPESSYPATFCAFNAGSGVHPFGNLYLPRVKSVTGDITSTSATYAVLDQSCRSTLNGPTGVPVASVPQASGNGNRLLNIVPVHNGIGAVFENADFNWSEDLAGGVFGCCSNVGLPLDVILDANGKQYKLFPSGSNTAPYNTGLMFAIRIS